MNLPLIPQEEIGSVPEPLIHYSFRPLTAVPIFTQQAGGEGLNRGTGTFMKPMGFWVSAGDGDDSWRGWCESERFRLWNTLHKTEIVLKPDAKILRIKGKRELDKFHKKYSDQQDYEAEIALKIYKTNAGRSMYVRWADVAKEYDGIVITPYIWERRLDGPAQWYYSWDCASGCIWNADAIAEVRPYEGDIFAVTRRALWLLYLSRGELWRSLKWARVRRRIGRGLPAFDFMMKQWPWMEGEGLSLRRAWANRKKKLAPVQVPALVPTKPITVVLGKAKFDIIVPEVIAAPMSTIFKKLNKMYRDGKS